MWQVCPHDACSQEITIKQVKSMDAPSAGADSNQGLSAAKAKKAAALELQIKSYREVVKLQAGVSVAGGYYERMIKKFEVSGKARRLAFDQKWGFFLQFPPLRLQWHFH